MTLPRQNSNTMSSRFKQNKPLLSRQPINKNEISSSNLIKSNSKSDNDILKKELKLCSQVWAKLLKLPIIKYLEKKHHPNIHLDTKILNEITLVYEKINKEEYTGKDEFYSLIMEIINKFGLICKPTTQVYMDYNNLKLIFNTEWNKCLNIMKLNKEFITSPKMNKIICHICNEEFKLKRDFKNHLKTCSINNPKSSIKNEENKINNSNNNTKVVMPNTSFSSPPPNVKYKYEKKDTQKNEKKELSVSYKHYSKFFKPEFNMEAIKIGDSIDCPFNNCTSTSSSLAKLVTHIMTNHQDKLTVISDYYCSVCGKRLPDIVTLLIHNVEHQHNKRRKIFSKDHTSNTASSSSSLINPLNPISNSFIPINTAITKSSLPLPYNNNKNKSINSKSSKLKRKYPFDNSNKLNNSSNTSNVNLTKANNIVLDTNQNKNQENEKYPLTPSPTSSLSQNLQTSPTKINNMGSEDQSKENNLSLNNNNINIKDIDMEKEKELKDYSEDVLKEKNNIVLENTLENKLKNNISEKEQLQLDQTSNNILQLKSSSNKIPNNNNNNIPSPISSPISHKINTQHIKDNTILSSPNTSHSKSESSSSTVSYTRSKLRIPCVVKTCKKTYKNIKGLKTHISRYHPEVQVNIEELVASYKVQSEQEESKENKKVHNILPVTTSSHINMNASTSANLNMNINLNINKNENPKNNNKNNNVNNSNTNNNSKISTSNSNLLSIENNPLLNITSDPMNLDKSLSSELLKNIIKGKNTFNEIEDNKKGKLDSLDNNSMNIDANNMNIKSAISDSNNLNLLQDYLINNNTLNNTELGNLENLNLHTANPYSCLDTNLSMPIDLQNNLLFNNSLSQTANPTDILKNPSLIPELNKSDLLSTMYPPLSNDLLSNNLTNNISNNLLMNLLYNNINNSSLPMSNINDLNLLNMNYNPLNSFSLYNTNVDSLNSLNNTQLQLLLNNHNQNNNTSINNNPSGESSDHKSNSFLNSKESFNTTTTDSHNSHSNEVSSNSNINEKHVELNKNKEKLEVISPISNKNTNNTSNQQDNHPGTSSLNAEFLNNLFINENNLNDSNLDLVNLNPSISDSKSLDLVNLNSSISDPKSLDLLSNTLIPNIKTSINETLEELNLDMKQHKNINDNKKK